MAAGGSMSEGEWTATRRNSAERTLVTESVAERRDCEMWRRQCRPLRSSVAVILNRSSITSRAPEQSLEDTRRLRVASPWWTKSTSFSLW